MICMSYHFTISDSHTTYTACVHVDTEESYTLFTATCANRFSSKSDSGDSLGHQSSEIASGRSDSAWIEVKQRKELCWFAYTMYGAFMKHHFPLVEMLQEKK